MPQSNYIKLNHADTLTSSTAEKGVWFKNVPIYLCYRLPVKEFEEIAQIDILKHLDLPSFHHSCRVELHCLHAVTKVIQLLVLFPHHAKGGKSGMV